MKKMRRVFAGLLALAMVLSVTTASAFAGVMDQIKDSNNAMAVVMVENPDCEKLPEVGDLTVRISSAEAGVDIRVPVQKVSESEEFLCMWLGMPEEKLSDEMMKKLAEIQGKIDLQEIGDTLEDVDKLLTHFQIEVLGLPEGHYVTEGGALVITSEIYRQAIDIIRQALKEEGVEFDSFSELIEKLLAEADLTLDDIFDMSDMTDEDWAELAEMGVTKEDIEMMKDLIVNIDQVIDYFCSDEFTGILIAGAYLTCDCPEIMEYQIQHRYYERTDGKLKLVGVVNEGEYDADLEEYYLTAVGGTVIKAADFKNTSYKGKTYSYMGSYDNFALYDKWKGNELKSFTLGEDFTSGLVLRYVYDKGGSASEGTGGNGGQPDPAAGDNGAAPKTGDEAPISMYILLLATAAAAAGCTRAYRKARK